MTDQLTPHEAAAITIQHLILARKFFSLLNSEQYPDGLKESIQAMGLGLAFAESAINSELQEFVQEAIVDTSWQEVDF
jgi:hypothetical protein